MAKRNRGVVLKGWARKVNTYTPQMCYEWPQDRVDCSVFWATIYADVVEDGDIGRKSLSALHSFYAKRGVTGAKVLLRAINCLQGAFYIEISQTRKANEDFTFGWFANRID